MSPDWQQPNLLDELEATIVTVTVVAPNLLDRAHPAGDVIVQQGGHFALAALDGRDGKHSSWSFIDLGAVLGVVTCSIHGNTIDPTRARLLADQLNTWADRKDPRP